MKNNSFCRIIISINACLVAIATKLQTGGKPAA